MCPKSSKLTIYGAAVSICAISLLIQLAHCSKVNIALRLAEEICGQRAKYVETKELPAPSKTGPAGACGHVVWNKCSGGEGGTCNPFEKKQCESDGSSSGASKSGDQSSNMGSGNYGESSNTGPGHTGEKPSNAGTENSGPSKNKWPNQKTSGRDQKEVVVGKFEPARNGTPFMVAIETANEDFSGWSLIGHGTVVDEVTILTTASVVTNVGSGAAAPHLFTYSGLRVVAGASNRSTTDNAQVVGVCAMSVYNDATTGEMDIGLIHLNKSLSMNEHVKKAELPSDSQTKPTECEYASWGKPKKATGGANYRKMAYRGVVRVISSPDCDPLEPNYFCTTPASCGLYDSGAPLICTSGSSKVVYGISSQMALYGTVPQKCGDSSLFSSISAMDKDWIKQEKSSAQKHCKRGK